MKESVKKPRSKVWKRVILAAVILAVLAAAVFLIARSVRRQTVNVFAVSELADSYYDWSSELDGQVTEGSVANIALTEGMVQSIAVKVGDEVKPGDLLLTYDTSTYQLTLSSDQADIAMLKSQITQAQQDIRNYRNLTPAERVTPPPTPTPKPAPKTLALVDATTPSSEKTSGVWFYNCTAQTVVKADLLKYLQTQGGVAAFRLYNGRDLLGIWYVDGADLEADYAEDWTFPDWTLGTGLELNGDGTVTIDLTAPRFGTFESIVPEEADDTDWYEPDNGSYYTSAEINQMIREKNSEISNLQRQLQQAELKYKRDQLTSKNGEVRAADGGTVTFVGDPHAVAVGEPLITIRGSVNATVTVYVDELSLDTLQPGDTVNVFSYESGTGFTATVQTIGDKPSDDMWYGGASSSYYPVTCVADDPDVELNVGEYCSVTLENTDDSAMDNLYLPMPFIRDDSSGSYVLLAGENGRLEKRYVSTGATLWGSSIEIRAGLTMDDEIAFPYGRGVREGNRTQSAGLDVLYGY